MHKIEWEEGRLLETLEEMDKECLKMVGTLKVAATCEFSERYRKDIPGFVDFLNRLAERCREERESFGLWREDEREPDEILGELDEHFAVLGRRPRISRRWRSYSHSDCDCTDYVHSPLRSWGKERLKENMGDRSPKEVHKKAVQKHLKDDEAQHSKKLLTETLHHPTSGHTATPSHPTTSDKPGEIKRD